MTYDELKSTNLAFASKAFRNSGIKAPITVMFECYTPANLSTHQRMISRGLGNGLTTRMTFLMAFTVDNFNADFGIFGFNADDIQDDYSNPVDLNISVTELYGEELILRRIDTTDNSVVMDAEGNLKPQWSIKVVQGMQLTHEGALIYSTTEFAEPGTLSIKLQQDQDLSRRAISMTTNSATLNAIEENKSSRKVKADSAI